MNRFQEKLEQILGKLSANIHLMALRDAFMSMIPFMAFAGIATFFAYVLLDTGSVVGIGGSLSETTRSTFVGFFQRISAGTISIMSLMLVTMIPFFLGRSKHFGSPMILSVTALALFFVFTPSEGGSSYFGTGGALLSILIALTSTELFIKLSDNEKLKIKLPDNVPTAVADSFNSLLVIVILVFLYALIATLMKAVTGMEAIELINNVLQKPLMNVGATLPGIIVYFLAQTGLFWFGIHPGAIVAPVETALLVATEEGRIVNYSFMANYGLLGGTGCCLAMLIALLVFSKREEMKKLGQISTLATIFNISEPVTFGVPIAFNPAFIIPFICCPIINSIIAYFATTAGLVAKLTNTVTWSTPIFINTFIASGGDVRNVILQVVLLAVDILIYVVFLKAYEGALDKETAEQVNA